MKSDLDNLMQARNIDAILVLGKAEHNPPMYYLTGGGHVSGAAVIKKRGEAPVYFCNEMEREEAAKSGLKTRLFNEYPAKMFSEQAKGEITLISALRYQKIFTDMNIRGNVSVYGQNELSTIFPVLMHLQKIMPEITIVGESPEDTIFLRAMETKDESEVARIRKMGKITTEVVRLTQEYLTSRNVAADETLLNESGQSLTIGEVKGKINLWLAEHGAEPAAGFIFAQGHDAGVPHSAGNPTDVLRLGQTIVFDIYPCEQGGGYFYDFTRTWSLGYATPEAQKLYDDVKSVFDKSIENIDLNATFKEYQKLACDEFAKGGHKTPMTVDGVPLDGYVHSLGHGLGLNIHELPFSRHTSPDDNILRGGVVVTIEPGLYYPEKNMGVRIEDSIYIDPNGKTEILAEYPYDFVLPMKNWNKK